MVDADQRDWPSIDGTISRASDDGLNLSQPRALLEDLDTLPCPA